MQIHQLKPRYKERKPQRIGRGGKRGTTSGRGQKGQKSRSGRRIRPAERDLILRLPKRRGFKNKPKTNKPIILNLDKLSDILKIRGEAGKTVELDKNFLKEAGFLPTDYRGNVKILGDGEIKLPVSVKDIKVSKGAKIKIEKAGGKVLDFVQKSEPKGE